MHFYFICPFITLRLNTFYYLCFMINLYQVLSIPPTATPEQILEALHQQPLEPKLNKAVHAWLLDPVVRERYNARLYAQEPAFFDTSAPLRLYPPDYACVLGMLFLPVACYVHAVNWQTLNNAEKAKQNQYVAIGFLFFILITLLIKIYMGIQIPTAFGLIWVFVWYYLLGKEQVIFIKDELDRQYQPKNIHLMIVITIVAFILWQIGNYIA